MARDATSGGRNESDINSDDTDGELVRVRAGISVNTRSPPLQVSAETVSSILNDSDTGSDGEEPDMEPLLAGIADWWDDLSCDERAEVLNLKEYDGRELLENLLFVDRVDEDGRSKEVIIEN